MKDNSNQENLLQYLPPNQEKSNIQTSNSDLLQYLPNNPQNKVSELKQNVYSSTSISPEAATKQYQLSKQTDFPVDIVRNQESEIRQNQELNSINYDELVNKFPKTAEQLADPNKAAAIRDDIDSLAYFEKLTGDTSQYKKVNVSGDNYANRIVGNVKQSYQEGNDTVAQAHLKNKQMIYDVSGNEKFKLSPLEENTLALIKERESQKIDYDLPFAAAVPGYAANAIPSVLATAPATAIGAGLGFVVAGPPGATIGSYAGTALGTGYLESGSAYDELRDLKDENGKPIEKTIAAGASIVTGMVNGLLELIPFQEASHQITSAFSKKGIKELVKSGATKQYLKNIGTLAAEEGATEGLQELSSVVFSEAAKAISTGDFKTLGMKDKDDVEGLTKFLSESSARILESAKAGVGGGIGLGVATGGMSYARHIKEQRQQGSKEKTWIGNAVDKIKESKIFKRDPELFKETTADTLGQQDIYMPAEEVKTFFQTKTPEELETFYKAIPEARAQIETALETGGDLILPGNSALTTIAQHESFSELQKYMSLSPESMTDKQAQDAFLTDVNSNVNRDGEVKQKATEDEKVKNNIKNQILTLRLPSNEAQGLITTLNSYYKTKSERYGSKEAQKVLDNYLKNLEIRNTNFRGKSPAQTISDLDNFINKARKPQKELKAGKPLLKFLKESGGVAIHSNLAGELKAIGVTAKTAPGLFKKEGGLGDVDNIPITEFRNKFPNVEHKAEGDYVDRQHILDLLANEAKGEDIAQMPTQEQEQLNNFRNQLDQLGIDIKSSNQEIKAAIKKYEDSNLFQGEQTTQGSTQFIGQKPVISLFKNKNRSTLLHELGHVFLQIEHDVSKLSDVSEQTKKDWKVLEDWLGIKNGEISTESHEKFARGFEAYLREGKAPSIGLRNAFRRFKSWLVRVYKDVKELNVQLSNPVREVFDRMLATDEAIDNLKNNPIFRADQKVLDLLDEEEKQKYLQITENAKESAKERLLAKALKENRVENTKTYKEEKQKVKEVIEKALKQSQVYRVLDALKSDEFKLNRSDLENYEGDFIKKLPQEIISEDGSSIDMIADFFGFKDGGQMLSELANAPKFRTELNNAVNEEMNSRYGNMLSDGTIGQQAINASENEARANKILYELNVANGKVRTFIDAKEAYKQKAKDIISAKEIKDAANSNIYYLDEIKAAREAGIALGEKNYPKAVEAKKRQLLNHYLYRESLKIKQEVADSLKRYERYKRKPAVGKVVFEEEYREKIVGLLQDFNLAEKGFDYQKTNISELEAWKNNQAKEEGILGLVAFPEIAIFQNKENFKSLTVDQFHTFDNAVSNLAHVAEGIRTLEVDGKRVDLDQIASEIKQTIEDNLKPREEIRGNLTPKQKANAVFESLMMPLIKVKNIAIKLDGEKPFGTFYNHFVKPVSDGEVVRNNMIEESYKKLDAIYEKHFGTKAGEISGKKIFIPEVNFSYSKQDMIAFALNWGNSLNRKRIKDGFGYNDFQVNSIFSKLTKNEWGFVQDMWDYIGSHYSDIANLQKKLVGFKPGKVRPTAFNIKSSDGETIQLKGGYYPITYTGELNTNTNDDDLSSVFGAVNSSMNFEKSYTKSRSELKIPKKVDLTLRPAFKHISNVLNDLALKEASWNSYKILNSNKVKEAIGSKAGKETFKQLDSWLKDIFGGSQIVADGYNDIISRLRSGNAVAVMGLKMTTIVQQLSGFSHSIVKIGSKNMLVGMAKALGNGNPLEINKTFKMIQEKSDFMKNRSETINRDIYDTLKRMERKGKFAEKAIGIYFWPIVKMQMMVDIPSWLGAYHKGINELKFDDKKSVEYADLMIEQSQGSGLEQSLSAIERGSAFGLKKAPLVKMFTAFYSYMNTKLNIASESYRKTDFKKPKDVAKFASDFLVLFWIETLVSELLTRRIPDFGDDDDDKALVYNLGLLTSTFLSSFPIAREAVAAAKGFDETPAGFSGLGTIVKGGMQLSKGLNIGKDEDVDIHKVIKGVNEAAGVIFQYPSSQINVTLDAIANNNKGKDVKPADYLIRSGTK